MNRKLIAVVVLTAAPIWASAGQPAEQIPPSPGEGPFATQAESQTQSEAQSQAVAAQPTPSSSVGEFVGRTAVVARQQAEEEVHYETRRQVQNVFNRLLKR